MSRPKRAQFDRVPEAREGDPEVDPEMTQTLELREEQLVAHKELREIGNVELRTVVEQIPGRLEVDAYREEVVVEHESVGQVVSERDNPWEDDGVLIIPIYEEQLVVSKRLVLRERLRVRRVGTTERQLFQDTVRRERLVVDDPQHTGLVREQYPTAESGPGSQDEAQDDGGFLDHLVRKALD